MTFFSDIFMAQALSDKIIKVEISAPLALPLLTSRAPVWQTKKENQNKKVIKRKLYRPNILTFFSMHFYGWSVVRGSLI
jgi:hypothetical protein